MLRNRWRPPKKTPTPKPTLPPALPQKAEKKCYAEKEKEWHKEEACIQNRHRQIIAAIHFNISSSFGFVANHRLSSPHNAFAHLSTLPAWFYFDRPNNLAFHDLTITCTPPANLRSLLGLGHKFCPTPRFSSSCVADFFSCFHHTFYWKILYACKDFGGDTTYDPQTYVNSKWTPSD